jgi:ABC-type multidrug transport system ATPase subunit/pSer/pThr/pTyr-binding forkhead associated (FHA) protein
MAGEELHVLDGPAAGATIPVGKGIGLGREEAALGRLGDDPRLSRRHARLSRGVAGELILEDLGSANGTAVNGDALRGPRVLVPGDRIALGETTLEVRTGDGVGPAALTSAQPSAPLRDTGTGAELLAGGRRLPIAAGGLVIGRDPASDVRVDSPRASRRHARVDVAGGGHSVVDLGSGNGTYVNGERVHGEARALRSGDAIAVGDDELRYVTGRATQMLSPGTLAPAPDAQRLELTAQRVSVGRDPGNDVVLDDPNVSRFHAELRRTPGGAEVRDLGSRNGTRVDGATIQRGPLRPGSVVGVGPYRLVFDGDGFVARDDRGALRLDAEGVTVRVKGREILHSASVSIQPGELVVIIGESGSGKSTLVKAMAGVSEPAAGRVRVSGEPVASRLTDLGYVPQDEIVHGRLTVREALRYAARLRLPPDSSRADLEAAVERVVGELGLEARADQRIDTLSGGQRKRAGVAVELLSRPSLLFLDEPTSGLDPALEARLMELFRGLAEEGRRAVVVVTHATKSLRLCDRLVVMGQGGHLCFQGPPDDALDFFGVDDFDEVYVALERRAPQEWRAVFEARAAAGKAATAGHDALADEPATSDLGRAPAPDAAVPRPRRRVSAAVQARVLTSRYLRLLVRDRRNLALLLGQAPLIGAGVAFLFEGGVFASEPGRAGQVIQLLFLLAVSAIWLGAIDGSREIVKERSVTARERAIGVGVGAYLTSKVVVLLALSLVQTALLAAVVLGVHPLGEPLGAWVEVGVVLALTGFVAVGMGLLVSALAGTEDQATSVIPLVLIPQLLFAGAIVAVARMNEAMAVLSVGAFSRWSLAGTGSAVDVDARLAADETAARTTGHAADFFALGLVAAVGVLLAFMAAFLVATAMLLAARRG